MISQLVTEVRQQIETYRNLQQTASQVASISATAENLSDICQDLKTWARIYPAIEPHLDATQKDGLARQASKLRQRLDDSRTRFSIDYAQRESLKQIQQLFKKLDDDTTRCWNQYATTALRPVRDQITFARQLPRMRNEVADIDAIVANLNALAQKLPDRGSDVKAFHSQLATLEQKLRQVKGLTREQKAFLNKVQGGTAIMDDMTESLLDWCKQEGLAALLKIKF